MQKFLILGMAVPFTGKVAPPPDGLFPVTGKVAPPPDVPFPLPERRRQALEIRVPKHEPQNPKHFIAK